MADDSDKKPEKEDAKADEKSQKKKAASKGEKKDKGKEKPKEKSKDKKGKEAPKKDPKKDKEEGQKESKEENKEEGKDGESEKPQGKGAVVKGAAMEIVRGLWAPDWKTRRTALLFFLSLAGAVGSLVLAVKSIQLRSDAVKVADSYGDMDEDDQSEDQAKGSKPFLLGSFTVALKPDDTVKRPRGVVNMIEMSVHVVCDKEETCKYLEENMPLVRDQILRKMVTLDREDALTKDGKKRLRESIMRVINGWLPKGKVNELYFSKLLVG